MGFCQTVELAGALFDLGGHSFHTPHKAIRDLVFAATPMEEQRRDMCPVFSRVALLRVGPTFARSVSGWGLDLLWSELLPEPEFRKAIVDRVTVHHVRPQAAGDLAPVLAKLGVDREQEMARLIEQHGLPSYAPVERGRIRKGLLERWLGRLRGSRRPG